MAYPPTNKRIWVAGHRGMVGGAVARRLTSENCKVVTDGRDAGDFVQQVEVRSFMAREKPDAIVLAAAKVGGAKEVVVRVVGTPLREFMHCDDLADALVFLLKGYSGYEHVNVGSGVEVTVRELAETIARLVDYETELVLDADKPDDTPRKLMDSTRLQAMGWNNNSCSLEDNAYARFLRATRS